MRSAPPRDTGVSGDDQPHGEETATQARAPEDGRQSYHPDSPRASRSET